MHIKLLGKIATNSNYLFYRLIMLDSFHMGYILLPYPQLLLYLGSNSQKYGLSSLGTNFYFIQRKTLDLFFCILLFYSKQMFRKKYWTQDVDLNLFQEEQKLTAFIQYAFEHKVKKKWTYVAEQLRRACPNSTRNGKQCRERWINSIKLKTSNIQPKEGEKVIDNLDLFFQQLRTHGKKWTLIAESFPSQTQNSIKNFFNFSLRKGLKNLNNYNRIFRVPKIHTAYSEQFIKKLFFTNDRNTTHLTQIKQIAFQIAPKIIQNLIRCANDKISAQTTLTEELNLKYTNLHKDIKVLNSSCKYKKSKAMKMSQRDGELKIKNLFRLQKVSKKLCNQQVQQKAPQPQQIHPLQTVKHQQYVKRQQNQYVKEQQVHCNQPIFHYFVPPFPFLPLSPFELFDSNARQTKCQVKTQNHQ